MRQEVVLLRLTNDQTADCIDNDRWMRSPLVSISMKVLECGNTALCQTVSGTFYDLSLVTLVQSALALYFSSFCIPMGKHSI